MRIWTDNNLGSNSGTGAAVAYSQVQLVDSSQKPVDLFIFNANSGKSRLFDCWSSNPRAWLEEGRPRELSSLPLATWSLLTTSVKEYQRGLREVYLRVLRRIMLPTYIAWIIALVGSGAAYGNGNEQEGNLISALAGLGFFLTICASIFVVRHFLQKHAEEVFHPSIHTVLQELDRPLAEAGFEVRLMIDGENINGKPLVSFLRFTPLRDDDKDAEIKAKIQNSV